MPTRIPRTTYADMYGPTIADWSRDNTPGMRNGRAVGRRGVKAKPPRHRRAAPRHVDLAGLGAPFDLRADVAGIKRWLPTVGSTHRSPSMALGALPPAAPLAEPSHEDEECRNRLKPEGGARHECFHSHENPGFGGIVAIRRIALKALKYFAYSTPPLSFQWLVPEKLGIFHDIVK